MSLMEHSTTDAAPVMRGITILNRQVGDLTLTWLEDDDELMEQIIQQAMDNGVQFWIIEPRLGGIHPPARKPLPEASAARLYRALGLDDVNARLLTGADAKKKSARVIRTPDKPIKNDKRKAKSAKEVAKRETVGVPASKGG